MATVDKAMEIELDRGPEETPLTLSPTSAVEQIISDGDKPPSVMGDAVLTQETDAPTESMAEHVNSAAEEVPNVEVSVSLPDANAKEDSPAAEASSDAQAHSGVLEKPEVVDNPDTVDESSPTQKHELKPQVNVEANANVIAAMSVEPQAGSSKPMAAEVLVDDIVSEEEYEEEIVEEEFVDESYAEDDDPIPVAPVQEDASPEAQDMMEESSIEEGSQDVAEIIPVSVDRVDASNDVEEHKSSSVEAVTVKEEVLEPEPTHFDDFAASEPGDVPPEPSAICHGVVAESDVEKVVAVDRVSSTTLDKDIATEDIANLELPVEPVVETEVRALSGPQVDVSVAAAEPDSSTVEKVDAADLMSSTLDKDVPTEDVEKLELPVEPVVKTEVVAQSGPQVDVAVSTDALKEANLPVEIAATEPVCEILETEPSFEPPDKVRDEAVERDAVGANKDDGPVEVPVETVEEVVGAEKTADVGETSDDKRVEPSLPSDETPVPASKRVEKEPGSEAGLPNQTKKLFIPSTFAGVPTESNVMPTDPPASPVKKLAIPAAFGGTHTDEDSEIDMPLVTSPQKVAIPLSFSGGANETKSDPQHRAVPHKPLTIPAAFDGFRPEGENVIYEPPTSPSKKVEIPFTFSGAPKEGISPQSELPPSTPKKLAIPAAFGRSHDEDEINRPLGSPSRKVPGTVAVDDHANASLSPHKLSIPPAFAVPSADEEEPFDAAPASPAKKKLAVPATFGGESKAKTPSPRTSAHTKAADSTSGSPDESRKQVLILDRVAGGGDAFNEHADSPSRTLKKVAIPSAFGSGSEQRPEAKSGSTPANASIAQERQLDPKTSAQEAHEVSIPAAFSENLSSGGAKIAASNNDSASLATKKKVAIPSAFGGSDGPDDEHEGNRSTPPSVAVKKVLIPTTFGASSHEPKEKLAVSKTFPPKKAIPSAFNSGVDESFKPSSFNGSRHEQKASLPPESGSDGTFAHGTDDLAKPEESSPVAVAFDSVDGQQKKKLAIPAAFGGDAKASTVVVPELAPPVIPNAPVDCVEGQKKKKLAIPAAFVGDAKASTVVVQESLPPVAPNASLDSIEGQQKKKLAIPAAFVGDAKASTVVVPESMPPFAPNAPVDSIEGQQKKKLTIPAAFAGDNKASGKPEMVVHVAQSSPKQKLAIPSAFGGEKPPQDIVAANAEVVASRVEYSSPVKKKLGIPAAFGGSASAEKGSPPEAKEPSSTSPEVSPALATKTSMPVAFGGGGTSKNANILHDKGHHAASGPGLVPTNRSGAAEPMSALSTRSEKEGSGSAVHNQKVAIPAAFKAGEQMLGSPTLSEKDGSVLPVSKHKVPIPAAFSAGEQMLGSSTLSVEAGSGSPASKHKVPIPAAFSAGEQMLGSSTLSVEAGSGSPASKHKVAIPAAFSAGEQMLALSTPSEEDVSGLPVAKPNVGIPAAFSGGWPARSPEKTEATTSKDHSSVSIPPVFALKGGAAPTEATEVSNVPQPSYDDRKSIETERKRLEAEVERLKELEKRSLQEEIRRLELQVEAAKAQAERDARDQEEHDRAATVETPAKSGEYEDTSLWDMLDDKKDAKPLEAGDISSSSLHSEPGRIPPVPSTKEPRIDENEPSEVGNDAPQTEIVSPTSESDPSKALAVSGVSEDEKGQPDVVVGTEVVKPVVEHDKVKTEAPVVNDVKAEAEKLSDPLAIATATEPATTEKKQVAWSDKVVGDVTAGAKPGDVARAKPQKIAGEKPQGREELSPSRDVEQTGKPNPPYEERPISTEADAACGCVIL